MGRRFGFHSGVGTFKGVINNGKVYDNYSDAGDADYTVKSDDHIIGVDTSGGTIRTVTIPDSMIEKGKVIVVLDNGGNGATKNIKIQVAGNVDGSDASSGIALISSNYGSAGLICDGTNFFSF